MNFPGPINANLASTVSLDGEQFTFNAHSRGDGGQHGANGIVIPDKHLLFTADYAREGNDLILSAPDQKYVVHDYFKGENRPALISEDGAILAGRIVSSLTGHVQYAQATPPDAAQVIGHVMKLTGSASVVRNGVTVELNIGDAVQKGDVVQTGSDSSIAMTLIDGSAFGMTSNARMVLNEMVYDPNGSSNSSFISLVQGTVTFVAGQTAKNGNMHVETPVATMGIRGTAVLTKINLVLGTVEVSLGVEPDQHVGGLVFYDNTTGALIGTMSQAGRVTVFSPSGQGQPVTASEYQKSPDQVLSDKGLFNQVFQLYFPNFNPDANPKSTDRPRTDIGVPPTVLGKNGTDPDSGRPTLTYTIQVINPDTHVTTDLRIIYVNTPPSFSVTNAVDVQATAFGLHSFKLGDRVVITDPDINAAPFFDVATPYVANTGVIATATGPSSVVFGSYLYNPNLVSLDPATGVVTYNPEGFRFLSDGETAVYNITFVASSGVGASGSDAGSLALLLTITGQNDAPTIVPASTVAANGVTEDLGIVSGNIKTSGLITFQDFDLTDAHTVGFVPVTTSISTPLPGFVPGTTSLGAFAITPAPENLTDTDDTGTVAWSFVLNDSDPTLQSLAEGQTITQTYKITITDSHGVPIDQIVTVTITGTNDQPVIGTDTAPAHVAHETPNTTDAISTIVDTVSGTLAFSDVDLIDTHVASAELDTGPSAVVWSGGTTGIPQDTLDALASAMTATVHTDSTNTGAGSVDWTFTLEDHLSDFLAHGQTLTIVYDIMVTDNSGTATGTSVLQQVTVQIAAANDRPVITAIDSSAVVIEDLAPDNNNLLTDHGSVMFSDADLTDEHTAQAVYNNDAIDSTGAIVSPALLAALATAMTVPSSTLSANTHTFNWDFALDNSLIQYLGAGETITATYTIGVTDTSQASDASAVGQTVTVIITGTNDAPVIDQGSPTPTVFARGAYAISGQLTASDPDANDTATWTVDGGTRIAAPSYHYAMDNFSVTTEVAGTPTVIIDDPFTGTVPPTAAANPGNLAYRVIFDGAFANSNGEAILDGSGAGFIGLSIGPGTHTLSFGQYATLMTDVTPGQSDGLRDNESFKVAGLFDLSTPALASQAYGIRLSDSGYSGPGAHPGDDVVELSVVRASDGSANVQFSTLNYLTGVFTALGTMSVGAYSPGDQIELDLFHDVNSPGVVGASYTLIHNGVQSFFNFTPTTTIFHGEDWTRAAFFARTAATASASSDADSELHGTYGVLDVAQDGKWVYVLDPNLTATKALAGSEIAHDTFNVRVTDSAGASDFKTVDVSVTGANDAPDFSGSAFGQVFVENGNPVQLVGTGGLVVHDVDNSNFSGGSLTASIGATGSHIGDLLFVAGTDHIQIVSGDVQFDADGTAGGAHFVSIGTLTNHGANLSVALNNVADAAAVMELTQAIRFSSTSDDPTNDQRTITFTLNDGGGTANGGHDTTSFDVAVNVTPVNDAPALVGDGLSIVHGAQSSPDYGTITKVADLSLSDSDEGSALSTISAVAGHGTVTYLVGLTDTSLASGVSATVTDINTILHDGITYTPTSPASTANTDKVTVTVTDSHGASDTINFIFQQDGAAPDATQLTGTTGKDLIFATQHNDSLTGLAGQDNFVFASTTGQHTITDFVQGQDKIDLHLLPSFDAATVTALLTNADHPDAGHTLLHLDGVVSTILVNNPALTANDFIIHV